MPVLTPPSATWLKRRCKIHVPGKLAAGARSSHVEWLLQKSGGKAKELILDGCQAVEGDFLDTLASRCPLLELVRAPWMADVYVNWLS
jgi:hypothetical protein